MDLKIIRNSIFIFLFIILIVPVKSFAAPYFTLGVLTSKNLLPISGSSLVNGLGYNVSSMPSGTSMSIQFSLDTNSWYNSTGVLDASTTLSSGENLIDLSSLGWHTLTFYYRLYFSSDNQNTPVIDSIYVNFNSFDGTLYTYSSNGTLTSNDLLPSDGVSSINSFSYTISSIPPTTGIVIQFSQNNSAWYSASGILNASTTLTTGTNSINLVGLGWVGPHFYYRVLFSSIGSYTPTLDSISLNYTSTNFYWIGGENGNWSNTANWSGQPGGSGGLVLPGSDDNVIFDSSNTYSANVDTNVNVKSIRINSGYTGAITQASTTVITTSGAITQNAGILTLSGNNTITAGVALNTGILNINSATALGTSTFTVASGTTINNTSGHSVTLTTNNLKKLNGNFTFSGTNDLDLGTGTTTLVASSTITVSSATSTLTISGILDGVNELTKAGNGSLTLSGANTYTGDTQLNQGVLNISNSSALGSGILRQDSDYGTSSVLNILGNAVIKNTFYPLFGIENFNNSSVYDGSMLTGGGLTLRFNDNSYNKGVIYGSAKFAFAVGGTATLTGNKVWGTISGDALGLTDDVAINHWVFNDSSINNSTTVLGSGKSMDFYDTSSSTGDITVNSGGTLDFYEHGSNDHGTISITSGGVVNFHDDSTNVGGVISIASGGILNFKDRSINTGDSITAETGSTLSFYDGSKNNGNVTGNVTFFDDNSEGSGTIVGSTTRQYNSNASTTRNFTTEEGHNDWILIAQGVVVDISNAVYDLATNIFKAFNNGLFIFGMNIGGGPVVPQISVVSPVDATTTVKWLPVINWDSSANCEYKMDDESYANLICSNNGSDLPRPGAGEHTLYIRGTDGRGNENERSITFTYDNTVPIYTLCGSDLLDEATRPYYYLQGNITGNCTIANNNIELHGTMDMATSGYRVSGDITGRGHNFTLKNITVGGNVSSNATTTGGRAGNIVVENSAIVASTSANGADGNSNINGGAGGDISIATSTTGAISANGGDPDHNGGDAGAITIVYSYATASGTPIIAKGGDSSGCGYGGSGGDVTLINSSGYSILNGKGTDSLSGESCNPFGSAGHIGRGVITGIYTPPAVPKPPTPPSNPNSNPSQSSSYVFGTKNSTFNLNLADLKPLTLKNLPVFGGTEANAFSFESAIKRFLFEPLATLSKEITAVSELTKYLAAAGIQTQFDLIKLKTNTVPLSLPKNSLDTPAGLFIVTSNNVSVPISAGYDEKLYLVEKVNVTASSSVSILLNPAKSAVMDASFDGQTYSFKKIVGNSMVTLNLPTSITPGVHILITKASPIPLIINVIPAKSVTPTIEKVKNQSVWEFLKFW